MKIISETNKLQINIAVQQFLCYLGANNEEIK